ncbi:MULTISPECIES: carbohydrate ABC transporter permease [unclassified Streptomyces]|uniref:carbohydrate ABC transporter permease n=1 Tax=unclassified Streptomyces TaxID=2593676 RepID=UPI0023669EB7|nr:MULTISPECIES: carbohydrate ABC transporter permease [unclassified Streptomyces]MDF3140526.1 carbohydrate ABC transporter permease [Streptomyces sp. T21Q-yed]WDF36031.1 carbohydrate ABC transporter permease [Streptomyces sp. T12]
MSVISADRPTRPTRRGTDIASKVVVNGMLGLMALYTLIPLWWLFVSATKASGYLYTGTPLWFSHFDLVTNIRDVFSFEGGIFSTWLANSALYSFVGATVGTLLSAMAGYALSKFSFRGRESVFNVVLASVLIPAPMFALPLFLLMAKLDITNSYWSVLLPSCVSPFGVYLCRIFAAASVPDELLEAARIDGAGEQRTFFRIALPLMSPALVTVFLFQFVGIWNNYLLPSLMLNTPSLQPVTVGLVQWRAEFASGVPPLLPITGAFLSLIPLLVAFVSLQRFWRKGLTAGAVK